MRWGVCAIFRGAANGPPRWGEGWVVRVVLMRPFGCRCNDAYSFFKLEVVQ